MSTLNAFLAWVLVCVLLAAQVALLLSVLYFAEKLLIRRIGLPFGVMAIVGLVGMLFFSIPAAAVPSTGSNGILVSLVGTAAAMSVWTYWRRGLLLRERSRT